ncbi:CLUMA_CG015384, isoform A [Clunio marinus]|uniref:CLUMA_CG015384, isoform A n=1 Tax=Clunio marinus TaxID=568069 RepID=A0A1J1IRY6_9DIPT|nr:CLUMA_CG015384, isoform A [Clunio marinus]
MSQVKTVVRIIIVSMFFFAVIKGQRVNRRQLFKFQSQEGQLEQPSQEDFENRLLSQNMDTESQDQKTSTPINLAILDSIFNIPIQAVKTVNELVRTLVNFRARLNPNLKSNADIVEEANDEGPITNL